MAAAKLRLIPHGAGPRTGRLARPAARTPCSRSTLAARRALCSRNM